VKLYTIYTTITIILYRWCKKYYLFFHKEKAICGTYSVVSHRLNNLNVIPLNYPELCKNIYLMHISNQIRMEKENSFSQRMGMGKKTAVGDTYIPTGYC